MYDVVIIGGGVAGLAAGSVLITSNTLLLEREKELGGRVCTHEFDGVAYELGAVLPFSPQLAQLENHSLRMVSDTKPVGIFFRGQLHMGASIATCLQKLPNDKENFRLFKSSPEKMNSENRNLLNALHRVIRPGDFEEYENTEIKKAFQRHPTNHFVRGNRLLTENLSEQFLGEIRTEVTVKNLERNDDCWQVNYEFDGQDHSVSTRTILFAADPAGSGSIQGLPGLFREYLDRLRLFTYVVVAIVTEQFVETPFSYLVCPGKSINTIYNYETGSGQRSVFIYYLAHSEAMNLQFQSDESIVSECVELLGSMPGIKPFGTSHYEVKRWPMVEALDGDDSEPMRVISSQHEHGFFACGDYLGPGPEKYGMHAALASGYLAGEQINKSF